MEWRPLNSGLSKPAFTFLENMNLWSSFSHSWITQAHNGAESTGFSMGFLRPVSLPQIFEKDDLINLTLEKDLKVAV